MLGKALDSKTFVLDVNVLLNHRPVIHIGFLDFTLFPEYPEFYATYKLMNEKNHHVYTDRFVLSVLNLKQIGMATEEDRKWEIDYWVSLFKATTWEEARKLAEQSKVMEEAAVTMYEMSEEDNIQEQCRAREDYYRTMNTFRRTIAQQQKELEEKDRKIQYLEELLAKRKQEQEPEN